MADTSVCTVPPVVSQTSPDCLLLSSYTRLSGFSVCLHPATQLLLFPALPALLPLSYYTPVLFTLVLFISVLSASVVYPCLIWN